MSYREKLPVQQLTPTQPTSTHVRFETSSLDLTGYMTKRNQDSDDIMALLELESKGVVLTEEARARIREYRRASG